MTEFKETELDERAINMAKVLSADAVEKAGSGHPGSPVSLAPVAYTLYQHFIKHDPNDPNWEGRDRFILSGGHASLTQYVQLYFSGYGVTLDDLKHFRGGADTRTPGHPEYGLTPGIEMTTGPLGQGFASAIGFAYGERFQRGLLDPETPKEESPFYHKIWAICGEGDIEEFSFIQPDGSYKEDIEGLAEVIAKAEKAAPDQPKLIKVHSLIAWPTPGKTNDPSSHGSKLGAEAVAGLKKLLGYDPEESFHVDEEALAHARKVAERGLEAHKEWDEKFDAWRKANPDKAALYDRLKAGELPEGFDKALDDLEATFEVGKKVATRGASGSVLNAIAAVMPELWGGSADLGGSNKTDLKGAATFAPAECATKQWPVCNEFGRQLHFGVREFTMGCITNGILLGSHTRPFGGTFFMFSDYERSAVRLAALMEIPNLYVWTHDSVAVGEDGPTHQPVEHLASFRAIPQLEVIRPADAFETAEAYRYFFEKKNTLPGAMVLTRQGVPVLAETAAKAKDGVRKGAYVLVDTEGTPDVILMASGSEVQWAVDAAKTLAGEGVKARVVSVPSMEWFEEQDAEYKEAVLPASVKARVSVEAGVAMPWYKYLGSYGKPVSIEQFGLQGDGAQNMIDLGITAEHVVEAAKASIAEAEAAK